MGRTALVSKDSLDFVVEVHVETAAAGLGLSLIVIQLLGCVLVSSFPGNLGQKMIHDSE